jgi:hypothetical protein
MNAGRASREIMRAVRRASKTRQIAPATNARYPATPTLAAPSIIAFCMGESGCVGKECRASDGSDGLSTELMFHQKPTVLRVRRMWNVVLLLQAAKDLAARTVNLVVAGFSRR